MGSLNAWARPSSRTTSRKNPRWKAPLGRADWGLFPQGGAPETGLESDMAGDQSKACAEQTQSAFLTCRRQGLPSYAKLAHLDHAKLAESLSGDGFREFGSGRESRQESGGVGVGSTAVVT